MSGAEHPERGRPRSTSASALDVIVQVARLLDGTRKIVSLQEITGMEENTITMQEIFRFEHVGVDEHGGVEGSFHMKGVRPRFFEKFKVHGVAIPYDMFELAKAGLGRHRRG